MLRVLLLLSLFLSSLVYGNIVAERVKFQFLRTWNLKERFILETLANRKAKDIDLNKEEEDTLQKILDMLKDEKRNGKKALSFSSDQTEFDRREKCNKYSLAYTYLKPGSVITINESVLTKEKVGSDKKKTIVPNVDFYTVVQILIHELGHHLGDKRHSWLNVLGGKVATAAISYLESQSIAIGKVFEDPTIRRTDPRPGKFKKYKREKVSGLLLPHTVIGSGEKRAYFVPNGTKAPFRLAPILEEKPRIQRAINRFGKSFWPRVVSVEVIAIGRWVTVSPGKHVMDLKNGVPDTLVIVNMFEIGKDNFALDQMVSGTAKIDRNGELYVEFVTKKKNPKPRENPYDKHLVFIDVLEPRFRVALHNRVVRNLRRRKKAPFGLFFCLEKYNEETHRPTRLKVATYFIETAKDD